MFWDMEYFQAVNDSFILASASQGYLKSSCVSNLSYFKANFHLNRHSFGNKKHKYYDLLITNFIYSVFSLMLSSNAHLKNIFPEYP